jgi:hypothetical protein
MVLMTATPAPRGRVGIHEERLRSYTENELPHPQERFTLGFCNLNPESINDSE